MANKLQTQKNQVGETNPEIPPVESGLPEDLAKKILASLENVDSRIGQIEGRIKDLENKTKVSSFKDEVNQKDILTAKEIRENSRENIKDPRLIAVVDEILGEDFGIEIQPNKDQPGFLFTIIVPERLSDAPSQERPIKGENDEYVKNKFGEIEMEKYKPEDRRSRSIASWQSYDAIKEHCERVRSYIVSYYQKLHRPLPEFKLKSNE
jgi:hypothetical protein